MSNSLDWCGGASVETYNIFDSALYRTYAAEWLFP